MDALTIGRISWDSENADSALEAAISFIGNRSFSTSEIVDVLRDQNSAAWQKIVATYGGGGRGSGRSYSAATFVAQQLGKRSRARTLAKLDYRPAPAHWGNDVVRYWATDRAAIGGRLYPDKVEPKPSNLVEGATQTVSVNRYERSPTAREQCIEYHGLDCLGCGFNFEKAYGPHGAGFIHVHHLVSLANVGYAHAVDPTRDLIPLCPNCHAMVHYGPDMLTIDALRLLIATASNAEGI